MRHKMNRTLSLLSLIVGIALLSLSSIAQACLPASPDDVFIGRFNAQSVSATPDNQTTFPTLSVDKSKFVFRPFNWLSLFQSIDGWQTRLPLDSLHDDSLIIGLAYDANGGDDKNIYTIENVALLTCNNNIISISEPVTKNYGWNRQNESCRNSLSSGLLDGFMNNNEAYYIQNLQEQYPTCDALESAFPAKNKTQQAKGFLQKMTGWFGG